jgi:NAD(P)-dependent dehydrogenase (short-subunit alcohol dehydrogenase family)
MLLSYKKMRIVPYPEREYGLCRCTGRFDTMIDFGGRRVVITGAGGGLGKALVSVFHRCNAFIVACDTDAADLSAEEIGERHRFDLLDEPAIRAACREICSAGAPAAFISNAGWTRAETLADLTDESLRKEMDLNFHGAAIMSRGLLPSMRQRRHCMPGHGRSPPRRAVTAYAPTSSCPARSELTPGRTGLPRSQPSSRR